MEIFPLNLINFPGNPSLINKIPSDNKPKLSSLILKFIKAININVKPKNYLTNKDFHIIITKLFILTFLVFILYLGYIFIHSAFFSQNLKILITSFNEFRFSNFYSRPLGDNRTVDEIFAENGGKPETPETGIGKIQLVINLIKTSNYFFYSLLSTYPIFLVLCLSLLLVLIVVKPTILKIIEPKGQELQDKIYLHKIKKVELEPILVSLEKQKLDLINMSTEGLSFIESYRNSLNIWITSYRRDKMLGRAQSNMIKDILVSNRISNFENKLANFLINLAVGATILTSSVLVGMSYSLATFPVDGSEIDSTLYAMSIVQKASLYMQVINILTVSLTLIIISIFSTLQLLYICNYIYNYNYKL